MLWINICYSMFLCPFYSKAQMGSNLLTFPYLAIEWARNRMSITISSSHLKFSLLLFPSGNYSKFGREFFLQLVWNCLLFLCWLQCSCANHLLLWDHIWYTVSISSPCNVGKTFIKCSDFDGGPTRQPALEHLHDKKTLGEWSCLAGRRNGFG